jgi:hypothetical protein
MPPLALHNVSFTISRVGLVWRLQIVCQDCTTPLDLTYSGLTTLGACYEKISEVIQSYRGHLGIMTTY